MKKQKNITYFAVPPSREIREAIQLTANTDTGARRQAKALKLGDGYGIAFFRRSDGCRGYIDI